MTKKESPFAKLEELRDRVPPGAAAPPAAPLGCGGAVERDTIVLQGDLRQRLPELLTARGVGRVTIG